MKRVYSIMLLALLCCLGTMLKANELTVAEDTYQKDKLPIDSYNCDAAQHNQFIYPATDLQDMKGKEIKGLKFHTVNASYSWSTKGSPTFTFSFAEVDATTLSGFNTTASFDTVYVGKAVFASNAWEITLDKAYTYGGGNLLVDVSSAAAGYISTVKFYSAEYASAGWANGTGHSFLPKTTFTYEAPISGPGLAVADGATKLASGANYSFGLAVAGTEKSFTLSNPGTESITLNIEATNGFGVSPANVTIAAKGEATLTVAMADATADGVVTITPTAAGVDAFTLNVSGTVRDASKLWCNFSDGLPEGWTNGNYTITTSGAGEGTSGGGYAGNTSYSDYRLYTPKVAIAEGEKLYLSVAGYGTTASWNSMKVQYSADGSSWTDAKSVTNIAKGSWTSVEVTEIPAGSYYIGFYGRYYYVTDIYGGTPAALVKNVKATDVTDSEATISWTKHGSETAWQVSYSTKSGDPDNGTIVDANSTSIVIDDLKPITTYYVSVRIGENGVWSNEISFKTACGAYEAPNDAKWTFESESNNTIPTCWDNSGSATSTAAGSSSYYVWGVYNIYSTGNNVLRLYNSMTAAGTALINSPRIILPSTPTELAFEYSHKASCGAFTVSVSDDNGESWTEKGSYANETGGNSTTPGEFIEATIDLTSYAGKTILVQFFATANYGDGAIFVDNVEIRAKSNCPAPKSVVVSNVTDTTATVAWTEKGEAKEWRLQTSTDGETWGAEIKAESNPFKLSGLDAETTYYVRVKAVCGESESSAWSDASAAFTTKCEAQGMPFAEDFSGESLPSCWEVGSFGSGNGQWSIYSGQIRFNARVNSSTSVDLTTPAITLTDAAQLTYKHEGTSVTAELYVNTGEGEVLLKSIAKKDGNDTIDLSAYKNQTVSFTFRAYGYSTYSTVYLYLDDVKVDYAPVAAPTALAVEAADGGATITWAAAEGVTWNLRYHAQGDENWKEVTGLTTNTYTLDGIVNGVTYEVQVQAVASANRKSDWTASVEFAPVACADVTAVTFGDATYNSVVVNWTASAAGTWSLRYKEADGEWATVTPIEEQTKTLTDLTTGKAYTVEVKATCAGDEAWKAAETTFTPAYTAPKNVAVASITDAAAAASWSAVTDAPNGYQYLVVLKDAAADWSKARVADGLSVELNGLEALTAYDLYVAADYGEHLEKAAAVSFTTVAIAPKNLAQDGESTTSAATFTWEADGAAEQWQWSVDGENWSEPVSVLTATADGLNAGTAYTFYVRSYYSETAQSSAISLDFSTECAVVTLPFAQDFGTVSGTKPTCWTIANWGTSANSWTMASDFAKTGQALRYNAKTLSSADAITPSIAISDACELKFYVKNSVGNNSAKVECKVLVNDGAETTEVADITTRYATATLQTIDLSAFAGKTVTIIFRGVGYDTSGSPYLWIDDVTVTFKAVAVPTGLAAEATDGGATVTWESEEGSSWNLRYRVKDAEPESDWNVIEGLTEKTHTLDGLTNGTTYEVEVQAVASANRKSDWTESVEFAPVACAAITGITYGAATYNSIVVNWTTSGAGTWDLRYQQGDLGWNTPISNLTETSYTLTNLTTGVPYYVQVKPSCGDTWVDGESFTLAYTKPANVAVSAITDAVATASWSAVTDAPNGYKYAVVLKDATVDWDEAIATEDLNAFLKDLEALRSYDLHVAAVYGEHLEKAAAVSFTTVAIAPKNLAQVGESTTTSATFTWEAQGAASKWQWSVDGENWSEPISALTATADELNAGTAYTFYVRSYYSETAQSSAISLDFTTECAVVTLPFAEDFEAEGQPVCWETASWSESSSAGKWNRDMSYSHSGYALRFNAKTSASATITTPAIRLSDEEETQLTFFIRNSYGSTPNYISGKVIVVDIDNAENNVEAEFINAKSDNLEEQTVDLAKLLGKTVTVTFTANGVGTSTNASLYIDDVKVEVKPATPSAIDTTVIADKARKMIENDQVVIIRNGVKYNAQGVVVK